ncbi:predicted protein [Naegleria gruberi]|uniref:Predicted protein n=1 Tax=Naegleria gruberi TaxID=5762 RepID=D2VX18_NAEGR|nr:uncharacterized protein NAEGRDRAFT_73585 [Naegleria gruberi]EFC38543.1 predicted protein [Naegleria gruberi]|eukprot:XP_002671287.1 predicted protein [Naegleria gruberi strain NEG-M]
MGADGGTLCDRRDIIVKTKKQDKKPDKEAVNFTIWNLCRLTKEPLHDPIVMDKVGFLYNKTSLLECLIDKKKKKKHKEIIGHIGKLSDINDVILEKNPDFSEEDKAETMDKTAVSLIRKSRFICPVLREEIRGQFSVYCISSCGHVMSEKAIGLAKKDGCCMLCEKPFQESDIIKVNPESTAAKEIIEQIISEKSNEKKRKKTTKEETNKKSKTSSIANEEHICKESTE